MSRRLAIIIVIVAVAVFGVFYFWPETTAAEGVQGRLHHGDSGARIGAHIGGSFGGVRWSGGDARHRHEGWKRDRWRDRRHRSHVPRRHRPRPVVILPLRASERVIRHESVAAPAPPAPAAPVAAPFLAAPSPLDLQGRARMQPVPEATQPREWVLGAVLPPGQPVVLLDPAAYGLLPPPEGQVYARVGGDVLRIEAGTRRIIAVLAR